MPHQRRKEKGGADSEVSKLVTVAHVWCGSLTHTARHTSAITFHLNDVKMGTHWSCFE
jgi:hypothetical protein